MTQAQTKRTETTGRLSALVIRDETAEAVRRLGQQAGLADATFVHYSGDDPGNPDPAASVIVVEIGTANTARLSEVERIVSSARSSTSVITIIDRPAGEDVRRLFRAGVSDVISFPINSDELLSALTASLDSSAVEERDPGAIGKLLCILKAGGGAGATTVAANLSRELVWKGAGRVALVDLDVQFGGVEVSLDIEPRLNFSDAVRAGQRLDAVMLNSMMTHHKTGFDILPAAKSLAPVDVVTESFVEHLCDELKKSYDIVILDMPTCWTPAVYPALACSDLVVPVVNANVRSADCTRRIVQAIEDLGISQPKFVPIANKVTREPAIKDRLKAIGDILRTRIELSVRNDEKIAQQAADIGACLRDVSPTAGITEDFEQVAEAVMKRLALKSAETAEPAGKPRRLSLFGARA